MIKKRKKIIKIIFRLIFFGLIFFVLAIAGLFAYFAKDLPDPTKIGQRDVIESTKIYDRTGQIVLYDIHAEEKRTIIPSNEIPDFAKQATLVIEDANFYHHIGLDWKGILRAVWANLRGKKISQGGSTITQQFIKNAYLGGPGAQRTFGRKIKEAILSLELERRYSKDEILSFYLNQIPYGSNAYGVEAASWTFFNKPAKDLTLAESALLAALPQAPSYYSPYGSHPNELKARQEYILDRMVNFGYISSEQNKQAKAEKLNFASISQLKAHHFVTMVREYLENKYGQTYADINTAGLRVYTTLDWPLQELAQEIVSRKAAENEKKFGASNAALVAINPKTGELLTLVGSLDYSQDQFNAATSPYRQPGSSFKPFAYAAAFKKGFSPETIIFDLQTNFGKFGNEDYIPGNYDGKFRGPISMRNALAQSINVASVKTLYLAGVEETIDLAQDMGITTLKEKNRYGLSLVLGGGEIKLIDETAAYGVFANEGTKHSMHFILKIEDSQGNVLEEYQDKPVQVLDKQIARQINSILSDNQARTPIFGSNSKLYIPDFPVAAKTGTTQDYSDGWTVGFTPSLVAGVWAGNNDYTQKMKPRADGVYVAAPIWNEFMLKAYELKRADNDKNYQPNEFTLPKEIEQFIQPDPTPTSTKPMLNGQVAWQKKVKIDRISGKLATDLTPPELIEEKIYQEAHCLLYYIDKNNPLADYPANPNQDPQFQNWETPVLEWAQNQTCPTLPCAVYNQNPPAEYDNIHTIENQPKITIISPQNNQLIANNFITIQVEATANLGIKQIDFFVNNQFVGTDSTKPYSITANLLTLLNNENPQTIKVRAYDTVLNRQESEIFINYFK